MAENRCPNVWGLFTTNYIKSHIKQLVKSDAQKVNWQPGYPGQLGQLVQFAGFPSCPGSPNCLCYLGCPSCCGSPFCPGCSLLSQLSWLSLQMASNYSLLANHTEHCNRPFLPSATTLWNDISLNIRCLKSIAFTVCPVIKLCMFLLLKHLNKCNFPLSVTFRHLCT